MSDVLTAHLGKLIEIANLAIEADEMQRLADLEKSDLREAYADYKRRVGTSTRIAADSPEWEKMMAATKAEYAASEAAKRKAYSAKRKLRTTIRRFHSAA